MELYALQRDFAARYLEKIENATTAERAAAFTAFGDSSLPEIITRSEGSDKATITIAGPLSPAGPSPLARFFGFSGTGYVDIIAAAKSLADDPSVTNVDLIMDTPGGTVAGMDQARQALIDLAAKKNVVAQNHGLIASAGYYLASAANSIVAMSPLVKTGSIGILFAGLDNTQALAQNGLKQIKIVSKNAPDKQADPTTAQGVSVIQNELDATERVFIDKIAEGRGTTDQDVIDNFGKGATLVAQDPDPDQPDALKVGMIDSIITNVGASDGAIGGDDIIPETQAANGGEQLKEAISMDLTKLKAEHPAIHAEILAIGVAQGVEIGTTKERTRVSAHLTMGESSGDMKYAMDCIEKGTEHDALTNAKYLAAGMNKKAINDRGAESENDLDTGDNADKDLTGDADPELVSAVAATLGVEL